MNKKLILLLLCAFLNGLIWIAIVPLWHTPDEQAHFGQAAFLAEKGRQPNANDIYDSTEEIRISEELLGTLRDNLGNNRFTFHPDYTIEYTDSYIGKYEASISALAKTYARKQFTLSESTRYPILYYIPAVWLYRLFYDSDIFVRVYAVRFWSLILFLGTIIITYKLGQLFFKNNDNCLPLILAVMVGLQPMMVFANIGVNSDALGNFIFILFLFIGSKIILSGMNILNLFLLCANMWLAVHTKPQFISILPMFIALLVILIIQRTSKRNAIGSFGVLLVVIIFLYIFVNILFKHALWPIYYFLQYNDLSSLIKFTLEYTIPHTYKEVLPWYWGVYDWLGVTYPRFIHRIINRLVIISIAGFIIWIIKQILIGGFRKKENQGIIFLLICNLIYFVGVSLYDWVSWYTSSYQLGIQGRYFFPLISSHMLVILIGWRFLVSFSKRLQDVTAKALVVLIMLLNAFALYLISKTYYSLSSFTVFITQASQNKPIFMKGNYLVIYLLLYIISCGILLTSLFRSGKNTTHE